MTIPEILKEKYKKSELVNLEYLYLDNNQLTKIEVDKFKRNNPQIRLII